MNTPSITPAQILAALGAILGLAVSFGLIDNDTEKALSAAASTLVPLALLFADAHIRNGRAKAVGLGAKITTDGKLVPPQA